MRLSDGMVNQWLEENHTDMIHCPYQPGRLIISREACKKRHLASQLGLLDINMETDPFRYAFRKGLALCRQCPIGTRLAGVLLGDEYNRDWQVPQASDAAGA